MAYILYYLYSSSSFASFPTLCWVDVSYETPPFNPVYIFYAIYNDWKSSVVAP